MEASPNRTGAPPDELLLLAARPHADAPTLEAIARAARKNVDWTALYQAAVAQGVNPVVYEHLLASCADRVPDAVLANFKARAVETAARNLMLVSELRRVVRRLQAQGIRSLAFKGPSLALVGYSGLNRRAYNDIDLLVAPEDFARAEALLSKDGYAGRHGFSELRRTLFVRLEGELALVHPSRRLEIDLHAHIAPRRFSYAVGFDRLWERRASVELQGQRVATLGPEDLLQVLCCHGAKHGWRVLRCVSDVAATARPDLDWEAVTGQAEAMRSERLLLVGLGLAHDLLGTSLPADISRDIARDGEIRTLLPVLRRYLTAPTVEAERYFERHHLQIRLRESATAKLRYACSTVVFNRLSRLALGITE